MNEPAEGNVMKIRSTVRSLLLVMGALLCFAAPSFAQIGISVSFGPPALPVYEQPVCPGDGYIWTPGYWAYAEDGGYYWVPGTWIEAPQVGYLWTPGYWGWGGNGYIFHTGYWGPTVGFYGGISYGYGYYGRGYEGGRWDHDHFYYNRAVTNVNVTVIHNVYNTRVTEVNNRVSYNGGNGGVEARATANEERAERERHVGPVAAQTQHVEAARSNPELRASANQGRPPIAATQRANDYKGNGVVAAKEAGAPYKAPEHVANNGAAHAETNTASRTENTAAEHPENNNVRPANPTHVKDVPAPEKTVPNTGNPATDKKYQAQQEKMYQKQDQEHQKLAAQQEKDHQQLAKKQAPDAKTQQVEQKHQQQTQQLEQKHSQQQQQLAAHQQPPHQQAQHQQAPPQNAAKPKQ
jgi:hypothetical protein